MNYGKRLAWILAWTWAALYHVHYFWNAASDPNVAKFIALCLPSSVSR